jgi:hypothetical protein
MNINIIINSIIIILILHIIILNINYNIVIGKKVKENFKGTPNTAIPSIPSITDITDSTDSSMDFLTTNKTNDDFSQKMLKYMQTNTEPKKESNMDKNKIDIVPLNSYLSNNNEPNFESNVADISKFYKLNFDSTSTSDNQQKSTPISNIIPNKQNEINEPSSHNESRKSIENPINWNYKNELPMNGGEINGIFGFDSLESQFANYNFSDINQQNSTNIPHNDLRKPVVYEN